MELESLIAYGFALGLPIWLVVEELLHRRAAHAKSRRVVSERPAPARAAAPDSGYRRAA